MKINVLLLAALLVGCGSANEVVRTRSPDGKVDAVLIETNGGATTSFGYEVYLASAGESTKWKTRAASLYGAVRNESAYGVNLRWTSNGTLAIEYMEAKSAELDMPNVGVAGRSVALSLQDGVIDPTAPSGGMLYNLRELP